MLIIWLKDLGFEAVLLFFTKDSKSLALEYDRKF